MAINLHTRYDKKIDQAYRRESLFMNRLSDRYSFEGVKSVVVSTLVTQPMNDYNRTVSANRYGTPTEMQDTVQTLTMTQDKSFSIVIDKGNNIEQQMIKEAGRALALQVKERAIPTYDLYISTTLLAGAGTSVVNATFANPDAILDAILAGTEKFDDSEVTDTNRTLYIRPKLFNLLKKAGYLIQNERITQEAFTKGRVAYYDGMEVVSVPSSRFPANANFIMVQKEAAVAPVKLRDGKIQVDPPGISGNLLEGRWNYDCFVLDNKKVGIYANKSAA